MKNRFAGPIGKDYHSSIELIIPHLNPLQQTVAQALQPLRSKIMHRNIKILDLGCGDGLTSLAILNSIPGVDLVALDNEPQMICQLKTNIVLENESSTISPILEDALKYLQNCHTSSFDGIGSCFVLHNFKQDYRRKLIAEIFRVLTVGGIFVNADKLAVAEPLHSNLLLKQLTLVIDAYTKAGRPDLIREWVVHYLEDNIPGVIWPEAQAMEDLKLAGFSSVEIMFRIEMEATLVGLKS